MTHEQILIVDYGSQVTQLIARRLREAGVYCEITSPAAAGALLSDPQLKGVVLSGGPHSVTEADAPRAPPGLLELGLPVLGICYGQQLLVHELGGRVATDGRREFGRTTIQSRQPSPLLDGFLSAAEPRDVWMSHGDEVTELPAGFAAIAASRDTPFAAIAHEERRLYGLQFHPEVVHTENGARLLRNFALEVCGCRGDWTMAAFRTEAVQQIRDAVGVERVICGLSGGVDSAVTAALVHEAIGPQLTCVLVDTGLLRTAEAAQVTELFRTTFDVELICHDASDQFLAALTGVEDPEVKRTTIGRLFVETFDAVAGRVGPAKFLAQGTLYPDVIESAGTSSQHAVVIKSHHNVGGLPDDMPFELLEPLRSLFKDEVRVLGEELGLPASFVHRHPFPGPGLAIRIPGAVTPEALDALRAADDIFLAELRAANLYDDIWQAFVVLLPVRAVGVMGDSRTFERACAIRAVRSQDSMTAEAYPFAMEFLARVATRIVNEVPGINRVLYDVTSKPPGTIEWE